MKTSIYNIQAAAIGTKYYELIEDQVSSIHVDNEERLAKGDSALTESEAVSSIEAALESKGYNLDMVFEAKNAYEDEQSHESVDYGIEVYGRPAFDLTYEVRDTMYCVHAWGIYPESSVLAGQSCKHFVDSFETEAEVQSAFPLARASHPMLQPQNTFDHLPDGPDC
ncbi:hypothetical protein [Vibrio sp. TRT 29B02]|uniref:hypothetical protein n=1 Tax=Vibrio sp. TRT 29B02 TaxID=3418508 RepID=UPI003CED6BF1